MSKKIVTLTERSVNFKLVLSIYGVFFCIIAANLIPDYGIKGYDTFAKVISYTFAVMFLFPAFKANNDRKALRKSKSPQADNIKG
jgi:hypothetical protein